MGDHQKRVFFCWAASSPTIKLIVVIFSLILVTGFISWQWKAALPASSTASFASEKINSSTEVNEKHLDLNQSVVGIHDVELALSVSDTSPPVAGKTLIFRRPIIDDSAPQAEEAPFNDSTFNRSSFPSIDEEILQIQQPDEENKEGLRREYSKGRRLEAGLASARAAIRTAAKNENVVQDKDYVPDGPMYWNARSFHRSYLEMEKLFKIFVYKEGEPPLFHNGPCRGLYSMEGSFIHHMGIDQKFQTQNPDKAHVHFLPFSIAMMVRYIIDREHRTIHPIKQTVIDYVKIISTIYPFWNKSLGADHFMLACHDWGPLASTFVPNLYKNSIRVLCNANTSEGFNPSKDVSFPEINLRTGMIQGFIGGPSASHRPILAFFAGGIHGPIRPILLEHWKNKDEDVKVYEYLTKGISYLDMMKKSKFCICPSGYEVASPRIVEAIYVGCVPVLISDHYVPPFSDVLNWKSFSVEVSVSEIPNLKQILMGISQKKFIRMQKRGIQVRRHFEVNSPPKRYDVFHMILHSIWLRRLNVQVHN